MPVWRCPHCGTPQAESSRCWVCRRSTTSCATCRHFRRGITSGLGLCGLDPRRTALRGSEMRACWSAPDPLVEAAPGTAPGSAPGSAPGTDSPRPPDHEGRRPRTFVPVEELAAATLEPAPTIAPPPAPRAPSGSGWSLWGDADL